MDQGGMVKKEFSRFPKTPELEPQHKMSYFGLGWLFKGISTFLGYLMPNPSF